MRMMKSFVPRDKQSRRIRQQEDSQKRGSWGSVIPVTRIIPNGKAYNRQDAKREAKREAL